MIFKIETTTNQGILSKIVSYKFYDSLNFNFHFFERNVFKSLFSLVLATEHGFELLNYHAIWVPVPK